MAISYRSTALRDAVNEIYKNALSGGVLRLYTGAMPVNGGEITTETLVGEYQFAAPCGVVSEGALTVDTTNMEVMATNTGVVTWVRVLDSSLNWVLDADAGVEGTDTVVKINPSSIYTGGIIRVNQIIIRG